MPGEDDRHPGGGVGGGGETGEVEQPGGLEGGEVAPAELDQPVVQHRLQGRGQAAGGGEEEEEAESQGGGRGHEGLVAHSLHCEGGCQDKRLETLGQEGVTPVEDQEVHQAGEAEEDVDVDDDELRLGHYIYIGYFSYIILMSLEPNTQQNNIRKLI